MVKYDIKVGSLVKALAGRDADRFFIVVEVLNDKYAMVADGRTRKLANAKCKNFKHLKATGIELNDIISRLDLVTDKEIYTAICECVK